MYDTAVMKKKYLRYLPLAFFSGIHGFALFAPYAAVVMAIELTVRKFKPAKLSDALAAADTDVADDALLNSAI